VIPAPEVEEVTVSRSLSGLKGSIRSPTQAFLPNAEQSENASEGPIANGRSTAEHSLISLGLSGWSPLTSATSSEPVSTNSAGTRCNLPASTASRTAAAPGCSTTRMIGLRGVVGKPVWGYNRARDRRHAFFPSAIMIDAPQPAFRNPQPRPTCCPRRANELVPCIQNSGPSDFARHAG
jgi:hypothetical protein